jgi:hypothetical protein
MTPSAMTVQEPADYLHLVLVETPSSVQAFPECVSVLADPMRVEIVHPCEVEAAGDTQVHESA